MCLLRNPNVQPAFDAEGWVTAWKVVWWRKLGDIEEAQSYHQPTPFPISGRFVSNRTTEDDIEEERAADNKVYRGIHVFLDRKDADNGSRNSSTRVVEVRCHRNHLVAAGFHSSIWDIPEIEQAVFTEVTVVKIHHPEEAAACA